MIETNELLDDVKFAGAMLEKGDLSNADIAFSLRNLLRMKYYPVAVKFFYSNDELEDFKKNADCKVGLYPYTVCQAVAVSRQRGDTVLVTPEKTGCTNAKYVFSWKDLDESEIKSHLKYTKDRDQELRDERCRLCASGADQ